MVGRLRREQHGHEEGVRVVVTCEFCGVTYEFDEAALDDVYRA